MVHISSRANPRYRHCLRLRTSRQRKRSGEFLIDGSREVDRAISCGFLPTDIFVSASLSEAPVAEAPVLQRVIQWAEQSDCLSTVEPLLFSKLCYGQRSSDVVAVCSSTDKSLDDIPPDNASLIVVLDEVEKPGNIGAVFRTVDAAGAGAVILTGNSTDPLNPNAVRASAGTVFSVPWTRVSRAEAQLWLAEKNVTICLAMVDGEQPYWDLPLQKPIALVFGNEAAGLPAEWTGTPASSFHIPMHGLADSLNVSISASIVLFEARRQRFTGG